MKARRPTAERLRARELRRRERAGLREWRALLMILEKKVPRRLGRSERRFLARDASSDGSAGFSCAAYLGGAQ